MTSYNLQTKHLRASAPGILRWCLDFPKPEAAISLQQLTDGLLFQGWLLLQDGVKKAQMYVRHGEHLVTAELNVRRPDVIEKVLQQPSVGHQQLRCGFSQRLALCADHAVVGFIIDGQQFDFVDIRIESTMKVLQGTFPWLFLDNDTNQSVAQFTGKLTLCGQTLNDWKQYLDALEALQQPGRKLAALIAPTKEMVYPQYYPHTPAQNTPVQQLREHVGASAILLYPAAELACADQRSFRYTDTHWTHHAAMQVSVLLAVQLGLDVTAVNACFANDQYVERSVCGDLGNKLFPPREAPEQLLCSFNYKQYLRYDNGLPNFGRVMLYENDNALSPQHCLIFGASSSYSMLNYLVRLYAKISIVHTAGNVDPDVIAAIVPDSIICQTNERFIVRAPVAHYSLANTIQEKLADMTAASASELKLASASKSGATHHSYFHALLSKG